MRPIVYCCNWYKTQITMRCISNFIQHHWNNVVNRSWLLDDVGLMLPSVLTSRATFLMADRSLLVKFTPCWFRLAVYQRHNTSLLINDLIRSLTEHVWSSYLQPVWVDECKRAVRAAKCVIHHYKKMFFFV